MKTYVIEVETPDVLRAMRQALRHVIKRQGENPLPELLALQSALDLACPLEKAARAPDHFRDDDDYLHDRVEQLEADMKTAYKRLVALEATFKHTT